MVHLPFLNPYNPISVLNILLKNWRNFARLKSVILNIKSHAILMPLINLKHVKYLVLLTNVAAVMTQCVQMQNMHRLFPGDW